MSTSRSDQLGGIGFPSLTNNQGRSTSPSASNSPIDSTNSSIRSHYGLAASMSSASMMTSNNRSGAGSPSHDIGGSRLFSKRSVMPLSVHTVCCTFCGLQRRSKFATHSLFCVVLQQSADKVFTSVYILVSCLLVSSYCLATAHAHNLNILLTSFHQSSRNPGTRRHRYDSAQSLGWPSHKR